MSKNNDKEKQKELEEIRKVEKEFIPQQKILEDKMINGLLNYVKEGKLPKGGSSIFMDCYNIIYNYTDKQIGDYILDYHNSIVEKACDECYDKIKNLPGLDFIDAFISYTDRLNTLIFNLSRMFLYISSNHLKAQEDKDSKRKYDEDDVSEFSMERYKKHFFNKLEPKLFNALNEILIREERNGNMEHRLKINTIMKTITFLDYVKPKIARSSATKNTWIDTIKEGDKRDIKIPYQDRWYHKYFKDETKKYVKNKAERDIKVNSAPEYVKCELKYINEEKERQDAYINASFHNDINDINYEYLIKENASQIAEMDTGINNMFKTKKKDELAEVFQLFNYYPSCLELIQKSFRAYIKERLMSLYNDKELSKDPRKFVPALISLKKEMDEFVVLCFDNHPDFQDHENKEFCLLMSKDIYPKQLANYADHCMRVGFKGKSEEEIEGTLNDIISLFKNINSKLVFQVETEKKMSDRLIKNSSLSLNAEKSFISKLKQESGVTYVSKMNEMINDLEKNKSEIEGYKSTKSRGMPSGIKFNVQIISQSAWDISKSNMEKIEILPFLKACIDDFEDYYLKRHQQTKLIWCLSLSKVEIQYLKLKNKNISTSTIPQLLTLLYLEKMGTLSLEKIAQLLGCNVQKVINDVRGLILNPSFNMKGQIDKGVILANIDPKTKEFKPETQISINMNFSVTHQKFNTLPLPLKKTAAELKASEAEEAQITKRYQDNILQATLTRIMKSRIGQQTTHVWLVNESAKQIDLFKAQPQQIKENIEKLIEKSIIKRNGANYEYIA
jgi:hypothetical protein